MHSIMMVFLCGIYYYIIFTYLLAEPLRFPYSICLMGLYLLLSLLSPLTGQWGTFLLVLCSALSIYFAASRQLFAVILSCTSYLLAIAVNHICTIPLSLIGMTFPTMEADLSLPFTLLALLLTVILLSVVKKFLIIPRLYFLQDCPLKLQWLFLLQILLCIMVMIVNFIYGEYSGYPTHILIFNGILILIFTLVTLLLFTSLFYLLQANYNLTLQQKEQRLLQNYTQHLENFYDELRAFRHDYKNILSTMQYYIDGNDIDALKEYFNSKVLPSGRPCRLTALPSESYIFCKFPQLKVLFTLRSFLL